jgi:hypothetical protein
MYFLRHLARFIENEVKPDAGKLYNLQICDCGSILGFAFCLQSVVSVATDWTTGWTVRGLNPLNGK